MNATIQLRKALVLKAYCYSCQGYRSIHRALQQGYWSAFQAYYDQNRRNDLEGLVRELDDHTPPPDRDRIPPNAAELARITPAPGLFRFLFARWLGRRKRSWPFTVQEIRYLSSTLGRLRSVLEDSRTPPSSSLIALRNELCNCSGIVEMRCYGLAELDRARDIEHFDQTERVAHLQLTEILSEPPSGSGEAPATRAAG
jgi:hypothetical protein